MYGATFLEVIISLLLFSFMLLGLDAAQLASIRAAKSIYYANIAQLQLNNFTERLSVFKKQDLSTQLAIWNEQNKQLLPQGQAMLSGVFPHYRMAVSWGGLSPESCHVDKVGATGCLHTMT